MVLEIQFMFLLTQGNGIQAILELLLLFLPLLIMY